MKSAGSRTYCGSETGSSRSTSQERIRISGTEPGTKERAGKGRKRGIEKSVLQSLKEFQARAKAQEQENKEVEKSKAHKKGDVEL